ETEGRNVDPRRRAERQPRPGPRRACVRARSRSRGRRRDERRAPRQRIRSQVLPRVLMLVSAFTWTEFAQQIAAGVREGAIYAGLALAIVIIYRSTRVINFAQGEMATFT